MIKKLILPTIFFVLLLVATINLFHTGFPVTHDGDVHLMRLTDFFQGLQDGVLIPRWAAGVNWGYGQPVFEFFYPLPSYIASLLHVVGVSFANSLKILLGASLILSGFTMYYFLLRIVDRFGAFVGAFLYVFAPYRFVDLYVRGDIGESFALIFVPLVLVFMLKAIKKTDHFSFLWFGVFLGGLILSHNIVSLMALPLILFYALYLFLFQAENKKQFAMRFGIGFILGFLISCFFWLPGLLEGKYTLRDIVTHGGYATNFTSIQALLWGPWSYGISGQFTTQLGVYQWIALLGGVASIPFLFRQKKLFLIGGLVIYALLGIFFMLPISNGVWSKIILLQNFQFPWRFLIVTIIATSLLGAFLTDRLKSIYKIIVIVVLIVGTMVLQYPFWHAKAYVNRPDNYFAGIIDAPSDTGESTPIWGVRFMDQEYTSPLQVLAGKATISVGHRTSVKHAYTITVQEDATLMENTLYFPGWNIFVDGKSVPIEFQNEAHRGLMIFSVPRGEHTILVVFSETKFRLFADVMSIIGVFCVAILLLIQTRLKIL